MCCPFERGRTLLVLGLIRRRARDKRGARDALEEALATFDGLGAGPWAQRARSELARISGRRPSTGGLTATEARVAALAARGFANKEIAAALSISLHTVEAHLSRTYRKLGIRSRASLAARLPRADPP
jgi:DNA-binding CsgD family transcriptional regulator